MADPVTSPQEPAERPANIVISVDAMGGDLGPEAVVEGIAASASANPDIGFIVHGDKAVLDTLLEKRGLAKRCEVRHADEVVTMDAKPGYVMRHGKATSMWSAISAVKSGEAAAAVSCGNTGALMAVSMLLLRRMDGVNRPAIACLWPSRNTGGFNVMLDVGADVRADESDLLQYAVMGTSYARNGLGLERPRIGLLNVGTEEHKGKAELRAAHDLMPQLAKSADFEYIGFVEGVDIPSDRVDVIVTDGFTGNVALKTGEGTAGLVRDFLKASFIEGPFSKLAGAIAAGALRRFARRIDPRKVNGGVFLGLNGTVVKSHGSADATGISSAIKLAFRLSQSSITDRLAARVALVPMVSHEGAE